MDDVRLTRVEADLAELGGRQRVERTQLEHASGVQRILDLGEQRLIGRFGNVRAW